MGGHLFPFTLLVVFWIGFRGASAVIVDTPLDGSSSTDQSYLTVHLLSLVEQLNTKMASWEDKVECMGTRFDAMETRIDALESKVVDRMEILLTQVYIKMLDKMDTVKRSVEDSVDKQFVAMETANRLHLKELESTLSENLDATEVSDITDVYKCCEYNKTIDEMHGVLNETRQILINADQRDEDILGNITKSVDQVIQSLISSGLITSSNASLYETGTQNPADEWIVFQRRLTGQTSFNRNWEEYKAGFGLDDEDFWLGLEPLHKITCSGEFELRVVLTYNGATEYAQYSSFKVTEESDGYRLRLGEYVGGGAGDSLIQGPEDIGGVHNGMMFSTPDRDNDKHSGQCAKTYSSGWWFNKCHDANLNGDWGNTEDWRGLVWYTVSKRGTVSSSEMKIRKVN